MYNKSPRGRLVDPAFTPLGGIVSRLLQRSLQAGLRLPGGLKPTPTFFTEGSLVWTRQAASLLGPPAAWLPGFVETLPATSQKQKRVVSPLGSHVCPKRKKQVAPARRAEARPTPAKRRSYRVLQKRCLQRLKNKSALFPRLAVMFARSAKSRPCLPGGLKPIPTFFTGGISRLDAPSGVVTGFCRDVACNVSKIKARYFPAWQSCLPEAQKAGRACPAG